MFAARAKTYVVQALFAALLIHVPGWSADYAKIGHIEVLDPAMKNVVDPDSPIKVLAQGFAWSEGPVWVSEIDSVLFSDIPNNRVHRWNADAGLSVFLEPAGYTGDSGRGGESGSNGLTLNANRELLLCQHGDRRVARLAHSWNGKPAYVTIAGRYEGKRFNSPNDLAIHSNGDIYFTDPPYGLLKKMNDPAKEISFQGVYRVDRSGKVTLLTDELTRPNGIAFSPDEKHAYVAVSDPARAVWMKYEVADDGTFANGRVLFDATPMTKTAKGLPDGLKVHPNGTLFATGPGGVLVLTPAGKHLGTIKTTEATANCCFGPDHKSLYMTADMYLLRVQLK